jgi:hypothetical protein
MAIAPVVIEFLAKGMPQVQQAFQSIHAAAVKAERAQQVEAQKTERVVKDSAQKRAKEQIAAMKKVDAWQRQAWAAGDREAARHAKNQEREAARAEKATLKAAKDRAAGVKQVEKELDAWHRNALKQQEREAVQAEKAKSRAIHDRISRTKQAEKDLDSWQRNIQRQREREERANRPAKAAGPKGPNSSAFGRVVESLTGAGARGVINGLQRSGNVTMGLAGTAAQLGGGFSIADSVMGEKNMRKQAAVLSASTILSGAGPGSEHGRAFSTDELLGKAKAIGIKQGIDPSEVLAGFDEVKKLSGNLEKAVGIMPAVAKIATATGADLSDTSQLAGNILAANPKISQEQLEKQLRIFTKQGVVGGVEVQDFARYGSRFTAGASMYGGDKEKNEATLGAMAQMARQYGSASSPAEAALGSLRFSTDVAKHAGALKEKGIDVRDGKGTIRDAQSIILDMLTKSGGDVTKLSKMGLGERGVKPLEGAAAIYRNAGGGDRGLDAVKKEFAKYNTGVSEKDINAANERVLAEQGFEKSMLELKIAAGEQLLPAFKDMLPALKELIPLLVDAARVGIPAFTDLMRTVADFAKAHKGTIDSLAAHPVGSLIAFELTKSFASAGLPALLRGLFAGAFPVRPPAPPGGGGGGAPGSPGGGGGNGGILGAVGAAAYIAYDGYQNYQAGNKKAGEMADAVRSGAMSPDAAAKEVAAAKGRISQQNGLGSQLMEMGSNAVLGPAAGFYNSYKHAEGAGDYSLAESAKLKQAIAEAAAAGVREGVKSGLQNNSGSAGAGRSEPIHQR